MNLHGFKPLILSQKRKLDFILPLAISLFVAASASVAAETKTAADKTKVKSADFLGSSEVGKIQSFKLEANVGFFESWEIKNLS